MSVDKQYFRMKDALDENVLPFAAPLEAVGQEGYEIVDGNVVIKNRSQSAKEYVVEFKKQFKPILVKNGITNSQLWNHMIEITEFNCRLIDDFNRAVADVCYRDEQRLRILNSFRKEAFDWKTKTFEKEWVVLREKERDCRIAMQLCFELLEETRSLERKEFVQKVLESREKELKDIEDHKERLKEVEAEQRRSFGLDGH